jgi:hypothetical protein
LLLGITLNEKGMPRLRKSVSARVLLTLLRGEMPRPVGQQERQRHNSICEVKSAPIPQDNEPVKLLVCDAMSEAMVLPFG